MSKDLRKTQGRHELRLLRSPSDCVQQRALATAPEGQSASRDGGFSRIRASRILPAIKPILRRQGTLTKLRTTIVAMCRSMRLCDLERADHDEPEHEHGERKRAGKSEGKSESKGGK